MVALDKLHKRLHPVRTAPQVGQIKGFVLSDVTCGPRDFNPQSTLPVRSPQLPSSNSFFFYLLAPLMNVEHVTLSISLT